MFIRQRWFAIEVKILDIFEVLMNDSCECVVFKYPTSNNLRRLMQRISRNSIESLTLWHGLDFQPKILPRVLSSLSPKWIGFESIPPVFGSFEHKSKVYQRALSYFHKSQTYSKYQLTIWKVKNYHITKKRTSALKSLSPLIKVD